jgi:hypothetical protein
MATKTMRVGSIDGISYDDALGPAIDTGTEPIKCGTPTAGTHAIRGDDMPGALGDINSYIDGTPGEVEVDDDGDGTVTVRGDGDDTDFTVITAIQAGGAGAIGFQYKTRALTLNGGIITTVGAESGWNDV